MLVGAPIGRQPTYKLLVVHYRESRDGSVHRAENVQVQSFECVCISLVLPSAAQKLRFQLDEVVTAHRSVCLLEAVPTFCYLIALAKLDGIGHRADCRG